MKLILKGSELESYIDLLEGLGSKAKELKELKAELRDTVCMSDGISFMDAYDRICDVLRKYDYLEETVPCKRKSGQYLHTDTLTHYTMTKA